MPKISQLDPIQAIIASDIFAVVHEGQLYKVSKASLLAGYLTESQIDQKIQNISVGGIPWAMDIQNNITLLEGVQNYPHNMGKKEFMFQVEDATGKPVYPNIRQKSDQFIQIETSEEITGCTLYFFG